MKYMTSLEACFLYHRISNSSRNFRKSCVFTSIIEVHVLPRGKISGLKVAYIFAVNFLERYQDREVNTSSFPKIVTIFVLRFSAIGFASA